MIEETARASLPRATRSEARGEPWACIGASVDEASAWARPSSRCGSFACLASICCRPSSTTSRATSLDAIAMDMDTAVSVSGSVLGACTRDVPRNLPPRLRPSETSSRRLRNSVSGSSDHAPGPSMCRSPE